MSWYYYVRMSHHTSAASGLSETAQLTAIENYCRSLSVHTEKGTCKFPDDTKPGNFIDRGVSGWSKSIDQRPAGRELLKVLKAGDNVVFYNVERAFRNTEEFLRVARVLGENGIKLHFAAEQFDFSTASGKFMLTVMAAVAAYQSDLQSERIKEAMAIKKLMGKPGTPKGAKYQWDDSSLTIKRPPQSDGKPKYENGKIHIYNRVSSLDQELSGLGMEVQRQSNAVKARQLRALFPYLTEEETYEDESVSAYKIEFSKRPSASRMLANLKPGDHIVIYRADRAFRNTKQSCDFVDSCKKIDVTVHLTRDGVSSGDEFGNMFFKMLSMFAEIESAIKSKRKHEINDYLSKRGRPICAIPMQYKKRIRNGKKQLVYNMKRLEQMARSWVCRQLGCPYDDIHEVIYAYYCMDNDLKPGLKRPWATAHQYYECGKFEKIMNDLPKPMLKDLIEGAIAYLERDIPDKYTYWCKRKRLPLDCTKDHLDECGISQVLQDLSPSHSPCANAPA